jgi:type I restriction-modification system DNA methylase subunit
MDVDFLEQITNWRELLAKNIAIRNENLNVDEINEAVQRILDRLIFIRNLEDREIEPENTLLDKAKQSENIYKSIIPIFNSYNTTYNGLLFKKHFSEEIEVDDKTIKDIIRQMCYPVSPFQFDVIEPEILGRIYEKFLGSKIRLTDSHRAKIEEKIEVRKAGGVYYTPEYIVEYIVQNTVGKKIEGLTPDEIKNIKIVDPACGSGSFLIGAYSYLLDYHQKWYTENQKDKTYQADWYKSKDGEIKVRLEKRGDILRNNIFGVDIDKEASEVAIMSLYLKMLDDGFDKGERDLFFVKGSVLPDMIENIKCGNSLISNDYFSGSLTFDDEEFKHIRPFNWNDEFKSIMERGGFDSVIGNPPWGAEFNESEKKYLLSKYPYISGKTKDSYFFFIFRSLTLLKSKALLGMIIPNTWLLINTAKSMRDEL